MQILYYADSSIEYNEWTKVRGGDFAERGGDFLRMSLNSKIASLFGRIEPR